MDGVQVISLEQARQVIPPKRQDIIDELGEREHDSVRALARALDRDKGQVSRDLGALSEHATVTYETDGRSKSPRLTQEHLVIEPLA
jgi:predicted transcriptional regulator